MTKKGCIVYLIASVVVLALPLIAMQFTDQVRWTVRDFAVGAALLLGAGLAYELLARVLKKGFPRIVIGTVVTVIFLLAWAELAIGIFGTPLAGS